MLFSGHVRPQDEEGLRETTWKEVMHKARVKLLRVPLNVAYGLPETSSNGGNRRHTNGGNEDTPYSPTGEDHDYDTAHISGEAYADEFGYQLSIIEDLDDDRVHSFEDDEAQPGQYDDVTLAGIREVVPIHEISKIFYADTGKILNIGNEGEPNSPVLLLRRDVNAIPPRRMMERFRGDALSDDEEDEHVAATNGEVSPHDDSQSEIDTQLQREHLSSSIISSSEVPQEKPRVTNLWRLPGDLDPEWMAFEVYVESEDNDTEDASSEAETSSTRPSAPSRAQSLDPQMTKALSNLYLNDRSSPSPHQTQSLSLPQTQLIPQSPIPTVTTTPSFFPAIRTSLSLLETLLRLSSLQQFQQTSHLAINDELLNFFLEESSTTGAGGDSEERRRVRREARARVGFDPYDESPVKRHGEEYQYQSQYQYRGGRESRQGSEGPYWDTHAHYDAQPSSSPRPPWANENDRYDDSWPHPHHLPASQTPRDPTPESPPLLLTNSMSRSSSSPRPRPRYASATPDRPTHAPFLGVRGYSSPPTPSGGLGPLKGRQAVLRRDMMPKRGSPLGVAQRVGERKKERPRTGLTDEGLGTSPGFAAGLVKGNSDGESGADVG